ncbi:Gag protease polyprotein [Gossypium australe]|uniref:Gag protease polyprotein n=1 Tax=Gossypium australe TaxID=47621 RepID=A0A5B6W929_9ROSI|nr:Gag protease polyprotein [Gossypium australe]
MTVSVKNLPAEFTEFVVKPSRLLCYGDKVYKNYPLMVKGYCFSVNLMLLPFDEFDVILGMDWLTQHDTVNGELLHADSNKLDGLSNAILHGNVKKGYDVYLVYVLDTKVFESKIQSVPVVCEFPNVFPKELPGLPLVREVEFSIDLSSGTTPISIAPCRIKRVESTVTRVD